MRTLGDYPDNIIHIACRFCERRGRYRLETLLESYGAAYPLTDLLAHLSRDCRAAQERTGKAGCKGPYLPDLDHADETRNLPGRRLCK
jgi:hypothetical protein